jgi:hypothetical protein
MYEVLSALVVWRADGGSAALAALPKHKQLHLFIVNLLGLQPTSINPFSLTFRLSMESLNLNTLAHSLPNANNLAKSEKDLLNNFKGKSHRTVTHPIAPRELRRSSLAYIFIS